MKLRMLLLAALAAGICIEARAEVVRHPERD
jgi:hypothetical protein